MKKTGAKRLFAGGIALLTIIIVMLTFRIIKGKGAGASETMGTDIIRVEESLEENMIQVIGNIEADRHARLGFMSSGKVEKILVKQGEDVEKGQILAYMEREKELLSLEIKQKEWERENFSGTPQRANALKQEIMELTDNLEKKRITAPFDGKVVKIKGGEGENYLQTDGTGDNWLLILVNRDRMKALVNITERDIPRVRTGQAVTFRFDTLGGEEFSGRVFSLSPVGKIVNGYAQMETELVIDSPDPRIYPGYSFTAEISIGEARSGISIPREYVQWKDDKLFVTLCSAQGIISSQNEVKASGTDKVNYHITSGLEVNQYICLPPTSGDEDALSMLF